MNELYYGSIAEREALAEAITAKGVNTNTSDSLTTMAENVTNIKREDIYAVGAGGSNTEQKSSLVIDIASHGYTQLRVAYIHSRCSWGINATIYDQNNQTIKFYNGRGGSDIVYDTPITEDEVIDISSYTSITIEVHGTQNSGWNGVFAVALK